MLLRCCLIGIGFLLSAASARGQTTEDILVNFQDYAHNLSKLTGALERKVDALNVRMLRSLRKQDQRLLANLCKKDSMRATELFEALRLRYDNLTNKKASTPQLDAYLPDLDTLNTSLNFIYTKLQGPGSKSAQSVKDALSTITTLELKFNSSSQVQKLLKDRKEFLTAQLSRFGFQKELLRIRKDVYYYSAQLHEYKSMLSDFKRAQRKAIQLITKSRQFQEFIQRNGMLARLFHTNIAPSSEPSVLFAGLQTRAQIGTLLQSRISAGNSNAENIIRENIREGLSVANSLKDKVRALGSGGSIEDTDGFAPNNQKTKTFFQRIEFSINLQSQKSSLFLPTSTDVALSAGYRLTEKCIIGIGGSYKVGWGKSLRYLTITHEGVGARSFGDVKVKGLLWCSGGFEMNYRSRFKKIQELREKNAWERSGLIGLTLKSPVRSGFIRMMKVQLLWDFLNHTNTDPGQALKFRVGYNF